MELIDFPISDPSKLTVTGTGKGNLIFISYNEIKMTIIPSTINCICINIGIDPIKKVRASKIPVIWREKL